MSPLLKLSEHNEKKEMLFELKYLMSLSTRQRFEMMMKKSKEKRNKRVAGEKWTQKTF